MNKQEEEPCYKKPRNSTSPEIRFKPIVSEGFLPNIVKLQNNSTGGEKPRLILPYIPNSHTMSSRSPSLSPSIKDEIKILRKASSSPDISPSSSPIIENHCHPLLNTDGIEGRRKDWKAFCVKKKKGVLKKN